MKNDLSIDKGDLTASLKLKRWDVMKKKCDVIDALYGDNQCRMDGIIQMGASK